MYNQRLIQKVKAIRKRQAIFGKIGNTCPCDYCEKEPGTDLHEIISKGRVMGNEYARYLSEDLRICCILCQNCHTYKAPTRDGRTVLFKKLYKIYTKPQVEQAFYVVPEQFRRGIELP